MNKLSRVANASILLACSAGCIALPITANTGSFAYHEFVIAGGGQLPIGLEVTDDGPITSINTISSLSAPDAVAFDDTDVTIAGLTPEDPSIFSSISSNTRNLGTEGAIAINNTQLYLIRELEIIPDGDNDVSERGIGGEGIAQATLTSELHDASANSEVTFIRDFLIVNDNSFAINFSIEGVFEMALFATAMGENAMATSAARLDMMFGSAGVLDILFSDTTPYINNQTESGDLASVSIDRVTDIPGEGHLSMTGSVNATGDSSGDTHDAFGDAAMSYMLSVSLMAGESFTMSHITTYSNAVLIGEQAIRVSSPATILMLCSGLFTFFLKRQNAFKISHIV